MTDDSSENFSALLEEYDQREPKKRVSPGDTVRGKVVHLSEDTIFVALDRKSEAILDRSQMTDPEGNLLCAVGDEVEAFVVNTRGPGGAVVLRRSLDGSREAGALQQAFEHKIPIDGLVSEVIKGGVVVQVAGARGFCPISQLDRKFVEDASTYVGRRFPFVIQRLEGGRGRTPNVVVSRRVLLDAEAAQQAQELLARLEVGMIVEGEVVTIRDYGAFIDLGGLEGMLHISEMGYARVDDPRTIVSVGERVRVAVKKIEETGDPKRPLRLALSLKNLAEDPWRVAVEALTEGQVVRGKVIRIESFGAFVELQPGLDGLVHVSEISQRRIQHPREVLALEQTVDVKILSIDRERRRLALSITELAADEERALVREHARETQGQAEASLGTFADLFAAAKTKSSR